VKLASFTFRGGKKKDKVRIKKGQVNGEDMLLLRESGKKKRVFKEEKTKEPGAGFEEKKKLKRLSEDGGLSEVQKSSTFTNSYLKAEKREPEGTERYGVHVEEKKREKNEREEGQGNTKEEESFEPS